MKETCSLLMGLLAHRINSYVLYIYTYAYVYVLYVSMYMLA